MFVEGWTTIENNVESPFGELAACYRASSRQLPYQAVTDVPGRLQNRGESIDSKTVAYSGTSFRQTAHIAEGLPITTSKIVIKLTPVTTVQLLPHNSEAATTWMQLMNCRYTASTMWYLGKSTVVVAVATAAAVAAAAAAASLMYWALLP